MSGDFGLDEPIIFYTKKMTKTKSSPFKTKGNKTKLERSKTL